MPWTCCKKALHFPPPLPKKIFLMAHPRPLLHIGPVAARVCPKEYSFLKQDFSIKSKIFVRTKQALCSQQLWASNFLKRVQKILLHLLLCLCTGILCTGKANHLCLFTTHQRLIAFWLPLGCGSLTRQPENINAEMALSKIASPLLPLANLSYSHRH